MFQTKYFAHPILNFIAVIMCFVCLNVQAFSPNTEDEKQLSSLITSYTDSLNQEQSEQFALLFTEDAMRVPPSRAPESTRQGIEEGIEKVFGVFDFDVAVEILSINVDGDFALVHGVGGGIRSKTKESKTANFRARSVWICKRVGEEWKVWHQVFYPIKKAI